MTEYDTYQDDPVPVDGGRISGVVTDFEHVPLVGVRVEAASTAGGDMDLLPSLTDGDGAFSLEGLGEGRYDLRFTLGKVRARTLAVPVGTDQLRVSLARPQGILVVIKTGAGQAPADLYHIVLERKSKQGFVREWFGRVLKPRLLLWSIRPGQYRVRVWGGPYLPVVVHDVDVAEEEPAPEVEVLLSARGSTVDGQVVSADGPVDALVAWRRLDAEGHHPRSEACVRSDPKGRFLVRGLPEGRYLFAAYAEGQPIGEAITDLGAEQTATVRVDLPTT